MSMNGLSLLKISKDTLCAKICSLAVLIEKLTKPHNNKRAKNPERKDATGLSGINAETIKATRAMLHQGKYRHAQ